MSAWLKGNRRCLNQAAAFVLRCFPPADTTSGLCLALEEAVTTHWGTFDLRETVHHPEMSVTLQCSSSGQWSARLIDNQAILVGGLACYPVMLYPVI